ncbi:MAG: YceI family protein [Cyclobacteriaceae bacterium]
MRNLTLLLLLFGTHFIYGQRYQLTEGSIHFFSSAPMEDIEAINKSPQSVIDLSTGEMAYSVKIKNFKFEKSLMEEHFNENYLESEKFPKSTFTGKFTVWNKQKGKQEVTVAGTMTIHGIAQEVSVKGTIDYNGDEAKIYAKFPIALADYKVKIPKALFYNIAESVEVTVDLQYSKL